MANEWEDGKLYRTQKLAKKLKDKKLEIPICVPTYSRPDAPMIKMLDKEPDLPLVFFIRKEQEEMYSSLKDRARIVYLKNVENIGQTRASIVRWAQAKGYDNIFMFDDKVNELNFLAPKLSKNGNWSMVKASKTVTEALQVWEYLIEKYEPVMSAGLHKGFSWSPANINAPPSVSNGVWCAIQLNVATLKKHGINYRDSNKYGHEDNVIEFEVMTKKLKHLVFMDLEFNNVPSSDKSTGGIQATCDESESRLERVSRLTGLFEKFVGKGHPGIVFYTWRDGARYVRMNWRYWKKYYKGEI